ncbi:hypothetical protein ACFL6C_06925 [Myxococcota bacterium]
MSSESIRGKRYVYSTANSDYYLKGAICIGVRDRRTGDWRANHKARGRRLLGGVLLTRHGSLDLHHGLPAIGDQLCFHPDLMTSRLCRVSFVETGTQVRDHRRRATGS